MERHLSLSSPPWDSLPQWLCEVFSDNFISVRLQRQAVFLLTLTGVETGASARRNPEVEATYSGWISPGYGYVSSWLLIITESFTWIEGYICACYLKSFGVLNKLSSWPFVCVGYCCLEPRLYAFYEFGFLQRGALSQGPSLLASLFCPPRHSASVAGQGWLFHTWRVWEYKEQCQIVSV